MEAWKARVFEEKEQLDHKRYKLESYLESSVSDQLEAYAKHLLRRQLQVMEEYSQILTERLEEIE
jgi:uncharacterized protein YdcH (DUF465 family)